MKEKKETQLGNGCMVLFGLPFFLAGFGLLCWGLSMFYTWQRSGSWIKVPATVHSAEIITIRGEDGNTYNIKGAYSYTYEGKKYTSYKIEIETGSTSAYNEKKAMLDQMQDAIKKETTLEALVNPNNPEESILFRKISMGMIIVLSIGLLFFLVGAGLVCAGIKAVKDDKKKQALLDRYPRKPWKADSRWNGFNIKTSQLASLIATWVFSIIFTVFVSIFIVVFLQDSTVPIFAWVVIGIFAAIALLILYLAIHTTIGFFKYGESQLVLKQIPLVPGSEFKAILVLPKGLKPDRKIDLELFCEQCLSRGSGKHRTTKTTFLHKAKAIAITNRNKKIRNHLFVPVQFIIPGDALTDSPTTNPSIEWKLRAVAKVPGVDYEATFSLPVFKVLEPEDIEYKA